MAKPQFLRNAPIIEALIDFKVILPEATNVAALGEAHKEISTDYPNVQMQRTLKGELNFAADDSQNVQQIGNPETTGFFYRSADQIRLVQFRLDGFTFNQLKPYTTWDEMFPEAIRLWKIYCEFCLPQAIDRLAVRFINEISIPTPFASFGEFLTAPPRRPPNLPPPIANFLTQITAREQDSDIFTTVTQSLSPTSSEEYAVILLDIEVFRTFDGLQPQNEELITETFNKLREIKNITFFSSVTERAVELFL